MTLISSVEHRVVGGVLGTNRDGYAVDSSNSLSLLPVHDLDDDTAAAAAAGESEIWNAFWPSLSSPSLSQFLMMVVVGMEIYQCALTAHHATKKTVSFVFSSHLSSVFLSRRFSSTGGGVTFAFSLLSHLSVAEKRKEENSPSRLTF